MNNANVNPSPVPVTGVSGGGAPAGGIEIEVVTRMPGLFIGNNTMTLSATYPANLMCVGGGCGSTSIPFSTISWTSANQGVATGCTGGGAANDIKDGSFNGSGQQLARCSVSDFLGLTGDSVTMRNVLTFQYSNATLYPSGKYEGRVLFTATNY